MKSAEKERLIKSDILSIESQVHHAFNQGYDLGYKEGIKKNKKQPKTGHWIFDEILDKHYYCSECKSMGVDYWDYCPYCGAKMVEPQESEEV